MVPAIRKVPTRPPASHILYYLSGTNAEVAQLVEHTTENRRVASPILALGIFIMRVGGRRKRRGSSSVARTSRCQRESRGFESRLPLRYRALTIVTKKGQVFSEHSTSLELPKKLTQILVKGDEVSDNLDALMEQLDGIESHRIVMQFLKKRRFIYECVTAVLMRFLLDLVAY